MGEWSFTVPGPPLPWMRAGKHGQRSYDPPEQVAYKNRIQFCAALESVPMLAGPVVLEVLAFIAHRREAHFAGSGDSDNFYKVVADALKRVCYVDDCQVVRELCEKRVDVNRPRLEVYLSGTPATAIQAKEHKRRSRIRLVPNYTPGPVQ